MTGKFKVWDGKNKLWFSPENSFINHEGKLMHAVPQCTGGFKMNEFDIDENLIPVHSTGKTDKNGVELFYGDIVKNEWRRFVVEWIDRTVAFRLRHITAEIGYAYEINSFINTLEKIGNKFENPELTEVKP